MLQKKTQRLKIINYAVSKKLCGKVDQNRWSDAYKLIMTNVVDVIQVVQRFGITKTPGMDSIPNKTLNIA